jgi:hypothetical protein
VSLGVLTIRPSWTLVPAGLFGITLKVLLALTLTLCSVTALTEIIGEVLNDYESYQRIANLSNPSVVPPQSSSSAPESPLPDPEFSFLNTFEFHALRWDSPDFLKWFSGLLAVLSALSLSSVALHFANRLSGEDIVVLPTTEDEQIKELEARIWARGFFLKLRALFALVLIFLVLAVGGNFIYNAGQLIDDEITDETRFERLSAYRAGLQSEVNELSAELRSRLDSGLPIRLLFQKVNSFAIPTVPRTSENSEDMRVALGEWHAFALEVCNLSYEPSASTGALPKLCQSPEYIGLQSQYEANLAEIGAINPILEALARELALELTGEDGRAAGIGARSELAQEGIAEARDRLEALLADNTTLQVQILGIQNQASVRTAGMLSDAVSAQDLSVFYNLRTEWLGIVARLTVQYDQFSLVVKQLATSIEAKQSDISEIDKKIATDDLTLIFPEKIDSGSKWLTLVATTLTRISVLLILVFLVQILVGLYRYSLRLAAFYDARSDALVLRKTGDEDFVKWTTALTPRDIDFGRNATTPSQHAENMVTGLTGKNAPDPD